VGPTLVANRWLASSACGKRQRSRPLNSVVRQQANIVEYTINAAIVGGVVLGALIGYLAAHRIWRLIASRASHPRMVAAFVTVGYIAAAPMTFFLSFVIGGNLGGVWGEFFLGKVGVPVGLAIGIAVVLAVGLAIGAAIGGIIGYAVSLAKGKLAA
jgi:hypothetical protein